MRTLPILFRLTSLRWRLTLTYTALIAATVLLLGLLLSLLFTIQLEENRRNTLRSQATAFAERVVREAQENPEWVKNESSSTFLVNNLARTSPEYTFSLYDTDGVLRGSSSSSTMIGNTENSVKQVLQTGAADEQFQFGTARHLHVFLLARNNGTGETLGVVEVSGSLNDIDLMLDNFRRVLFGTMLVSLLLSVVVGLYMAQTVTRPLVQVREVASQVASGDFSAHVENPSSDEVGDLARTVNYMASELKQIDDLRSQFVSNVSHELKTPLTAIKGFVVTSLDDPEDTVTQRRALEVIDQETDRLSRLVDELLSFARLEAGKVQLRMERINLGALIEEVVHAQQPRSERYRISIQTRLSSGMWLRADRDKLKQVLINLLDNALKFTPPGGNILVSAQLGRLPCRSLPANGQLQPLYHMSNGSAPSGDDMQDYVTVRVTDTGIGILPEDLPHVFERFYRGHTTISPGNETSLPRTSGTGLGLSIVRLLIEAHAGCVSIESTPQLGTTVTVVLPRNDPERR